MNDFRLKIRSRKKNKRKWFAILKKQIMIEHERTYKDNKTELHELLSEHRNDPYPVNKLIKACRYGTGESVNATTEKGILIMKKLVDEFSDNHYFLAIIGCICVCQGDTKEAIHYFKLAIEKGNKRAIYNLGVLYYKKDDEKEAIHYFKLAVENGDKDAMCNLGLLYKEKGNAELANYRLLRSGNSENVPKYYGQMLTWMYRAHALDATFPVQVPMDVRRLIASYIKF